MLDTLGRKSPTSRQRRCGLFWHGMLSVAQERNDKNFLSIFPGFAEHFDPFIQFERACMTPFVVQPPFRSEAVARVA